MKRELTPAQLVLRSISKKYREEIWSPFTKAVRDFELASTGDKVAVLLQGDGAGVLSAILLQMLSSYGKVSYEVVPVLVTSSNESETLLAECCDLKTILHPIVGENLDNLCQQVADLTGCEKIAVGCTCEYTAQHTLEELLSGGTLEGVTPKKKLESGVEVVLPLYYISEKNIARWCNYNGLNLSPVWEPVGENLELAKSVISKLEKQGEEITQNIVSSVNNAQIDTIINYVSKGVNNNFTEDY